jgi:hypothetical protein
MESHQTSNREEETSISPALAASHHQKIKEESHLIETNIIFIHHNLSYYKRTLGLNRHSNPNPNVTNFWPKAKPTFKMTNNLNLND